MNKREKILVIVIACVGGLFVLGKGVPAALEPIHELRDERTGKRGQLDQLVAETSMLERLTREYKSIARKSPSQDPQETQLKMQEELTRIIAKCNLSDHRITSISINTDRKTGLTTVPATVSGEGDIASVVKFMALCYELPYSMRITGLTLSPKSARRGKDRQLKLSAKIEALVLQPNELAAEGKLGKPDGTPRYALANAKAYALIKQRNPFSPYKPPPKPTKKPEPVEVAKRPDSKKPDKPKPVREDPQRRYKVIRAILKYQTSEDVEELYLVNTNSRTSEYVKRGESLDGGDLVFLHTLGAVVRKQNVDWVYPVGKSLKDCVELHASDEYPEIRAAMEHFAREQQAKIAEAAKKMKKQPAPPPDEPAKEDQPPEAAKPEEETPSPEPAAEIAPEEEPSEESEPTGDAADAEQPSSQPSEQPAVTKDRNPNAKSKRKGSSKRDLDNLRRKKNKNHQPKTPNSSAKDDKAEENSDAK